MSSNPQYKRIILISSVVLTSIVLWATAKPWLESPLRFSGLVVIIWPALAISFLGAITGLAWVLLTNRWDRLAAILGSWASFLIFWQPSIWYISILPIFSLFWWEAGSRIQNDLSDRRRIRLTAAVGRGVKLILLGAFLMISLGFYLLPTSQEANLNSLSAGITGSLESAYDSSLIKSRLAELPPAMQAQVKEDIARQVDNFIRSWLGQWSAYVPPFFALALFLALWSTSFIFREIAIWLSLGLFNILKMMRFLKISETQVKAEIIEI